VSYIFLIDGFGLGGTELNAARTLEALSRRNIRVTVVHFQADGALHDRVASSGHDMLHVPVVPLWSPRIVSRVSALAATFRRAQAAVIHSQDVYSNILGVAATRMSRRPILTSRRWKDDVPRAVLTPLNAWAHRHSTRVLPNSGTLAPTLLAEGVRAARIAVHENFIDDAALARLHPDDVRAWRVRLGIPVDALVVGCVARLSRVKRHDVIIDGADRGACEARVRERGLQNSVVFTGTLPNAPLSQQLFDVAILASENEGFPNALVEAAACGVPLVSTLVGGVTDVLVPEETGIGVAVGNSPETAEAILTLLRDAAMRQRLGSAGRARVAARFSETAAMTRLLDLYRHPRVTPA
jgi:glycosyltransferase involved in cell wall biosynthesis